MRPDRDRVGAAAALVAGPALAFGVVGANVFGRAVVLLLTAAAGARLLPSGTDEVPWRLLERLLRRAVPARRRLLRLPGGERCGDTKLPGEPGGSLP